MKGKFILLASVTALAFGVTSTSVLAQDPPKSSPRLAQFSFKLEQGDSPPSACPSVGNRGTDPKTKATYECYDIYNDTKFDPSQPTLAPGNGVPIVVTVSGTGGAGSGGACLGPTSGWQIPVGYHGYLWSNPSATGYACIVNQLTIADGSNSAKLPTVNQAVLPESSSGTANTHVVVNTKQTTTGVPLNFTMQVLTESTKK